MRAAFVLGPGEVEVRRVPPPPAGEGEVRLAVAACGVCGSNLHGWRHPELAVGDLTVPGAAGHEVAATVIEGGAAEGLVVVEPNLLGACLDCEACAIGRYWFCRDRAPVPAWGFSEEMVAPVHALFAVPAEVAPEVATLVEPLACAIHALRDSTTGRSRGGRVDGARIVVLGAGVAGLLAVAAARHLGATWVGATARHPHQAAAAAALGADAVERAGDPEGEQRLRRTRPDIVVEGVGGTADTFELASRLVAAGGEVVVLGLFDAAQRIDARRAVFRELRLSFPVTYGRIDGVHDFELAIGLLSKEAALLGRLVTHRFPLDGVAAAFTTAADKTTGALRVVVMP